MSRLQNEILMKQVQLQQLQQLQQVEQLKQSQQVQQSSIFSLLGDTCADQPRVSPTTNSFGSVELLFSILQCKINALYSREQLFRVADNFSE